MIPFFAEQKHRSDAVRQYCVTHLTAAPLRHTLKAMGYAIVRLAKRQARASVRGMLKHALREAAVPNAEAGAGRPQVLAGDLTSAAALGRLQAALKAAPRVQKNTVQALDLLVTASRADMLSWPRERQDAYFKDALALLASRFGGMANVLTAVIHRDESTPHMQVLVMPRDQDGRFAAIKMIGGPVGLRQLHDDFHTQIGKKYGLLRGEKGERVEHVPIKQFYSHMAKAGADPIPAYQQLPAEPTLSDRLTGKAAAIEAEREKVQAHNKRTRERLASAARVAGAVHPSNIARQAARYRAALAAKDDLKKAEHAHAAAAQLELEARNARAAADHFWDKNGAQVLDRWSKTMDPKIVDQLARQLGIELVAGKPLIDQMRRQGRGDTLIQCAALLDKTLRSMEVADTPRPSQAQAPAVRERGG